MTTAGEIAIDELSDADLPAVVDLCRLALDLPEDAAEATEIVTRLWEGGSRRRTVALAARRPAAGAGPASLVGVVLGSLGHEDAALGHVDLVAVHPRARRQGVGRALFAAVERRLAGRGATEAVLVGNPPYYAWPGIDVRYTPAICAATAFGYEHHRTAWNMTADLSADSSPGLRDTAPAEARLAEAGIRVRRATVGDRDALVGFARTEFPGTWEGEIVDSLDRPGAGCHLALRDGEVLGFAAYGASRPSWFGPIGTAAGAQGTGIGSVLMRRCLRDQRAAGHRTVQIGWVGPVPFYTATVGARIERVFFLFRKAL